MSEYPKCPDCNMPDQPGAPKHFDDCPQIASLEDARRLALRKSIRNGDLQAELDHARDALKKIREIARDDGRECNLPGALADVFAICDETLNPENYVD